MKNVFAIIFLLLLFGCSSEKNESANNKVITEVKLKEESKDIPVSSERPDWLTFESNEYYYSDTTKIHFLLKFKYPSNLVAEPIENGRCIGQKRKLESDEDFITNTMDCCIWIFDLKSQSVENYLNVVKKQLNKKLIDKRDSILIANNKALRVRFYEEGSNKLLSDNAFVDIDEYDTSLQIHNENLKTADFDYLLKTIELVKK